MIKKAVISNRIYLPFEEKYYEKLKEELTYTIPSKIFGDPPEEKSTIRRLGKTAISIPVGRIDLIPHDFTVIDKRTVAPVDFPEFKYELYPEQQEVYDVVDDNSLISANPSWGKTFTGIAIARKLGQKALVIVHTSFLRKQWEKEVKKALGIEPGVIGGSGKEGRVDYDSCITISNIQKLRSRALQLREEFGTVIIDEVHHVPAKVFEETLNVFKARYKLGLSATLERKDMLHVVLPDYFGFDTYYGRSSNEMVPKVLIIKSDIPFDSRQTIPWALKVNELVNNEDYIKLVSDVAYSYMKAGHKVLVLSDRTEFLKTCNNIHDDCSVLITGTTCDNDREIYKEFVEKDPNHNIVYGAISIFKEGISWDFLSCIVVAAPINNDPLLKQLIGRITRIYDSKLQPIVVDINLKGTTAKRQAQARAAYYMDNGWEIMYADLT